MSGSGELRANGGAGELSRGPGGGGRIAVWHHMPLAMVEQRAATRNVTGLARSPLYASFTGGLHTDVTPSKIPPPEPPPYQPEEGTIGFYTIAGTMVILR